MRDRAWVRPVNFHATRHTATTFALDDPIPAHDVARKLGHASAATTLRLYTDVTRHSTEALADAIDTRYGPRFTVHPPSASGPARSG
jgi:integrase